MLSANQLIKKARGDIIPSLVFYVGKQLTRDLIKDLIEDVISSIPGKPPIESIAYRLSLWEDTKITRKELLPIAFSLLAWEHRYEPAKKDVIQTCDVYINRVVTNRKVCSIQMIIIRGPNAGQTITWSGPLSKAYLLAERAGFPKFKSPNIRELSGMIHTLELKYKRVHEVLEKSGNKTFNNKLRSKRKDCEYYAQYPCDHCPRGRDTCPLAARPFTLKRNENGKWMEKI